MQGYDQKLDDQQLENVDKLVREDVLQGKDQEQQDSKPISLILTYIRFLPKLTAVVRKKKIIQTNKNLRELFQKPSITAFKRNKNLKIIIGGTRIKNGKVKKFSISSRTGKCTPCLIGRKNSMLQPSGDNKHIHESTNKANI